jgi:hypothetical protein
VDSAVMFECERSWKQDVMQKTVWRVVGQTDIDWRGKSSGRRLTHSSIHQTTKIEHLVLTKNWELKVGRRKARSIEKATSHIITFAANKSHKLQRSIPRVFLSSINSNGE